MGNVYATVSLEGFSVSMDADFDDSVTIGGGRTPQKKSAENALAALDRLRDRLRAQIQHAADIKPEMSMRQGGIINTQRNPTTFNDPVAPQPVIRDDRED